MITPYEVLGVRAWASAEEIHTAYRSLVKACHPDRFQDPARKRAAQEEMIRLNLAYEEALRRTVPRPSAPAVRELDAEEAVALAEKMLEKAKKADEEAARRILVKGKAVLTPEAAEVFAENQILLYGNESQTVGSKETGKTVHMTMLGAEIVLLEGIRLKDVDEGVYLLDCAPINLGGSDGAPCRAVLISEY